MGEHFNEPLHDQREVKVFNFKHFGKTPINKNWKIFRIPKLFLLYIVRRKNVRRLRKQNRHSFQL